MGQVEEDALERWAKNQLEDIKFRAGQLVAQAENQTFGDRLNAGIELLKLQMGSQTVYERYRFMKRLQLMSKERSEQ